MEESLRGRRSCALWEMRRMGEGRKRATERGEKVVAGRRGNSAMDSDDNRSSRQHHSSMDIRNYFDNV